MRRIAIALCTFLALAFVPALPSKAADSNQDLLNKYLWPPVSSVQGNPLDYPLLGYRFGIVDDFTQGGGAASFISVGGALQPLCSGFNDSVCLAEIARGGGWWLNAILPPCDLAKSKEACVEGVKITDGKGTRELLFNKILTGPNWLADANHGDVPGSTPSLWRDPADSDSTHGYKVTAGGGLYANGSVSSSLHTGFASFESNITAYQEVQGNYGGYSPSTTNGVTHAGWVSGPGCIWSEQGVCGARVNFPTGARLQMRVHIPFELSSWLIGRISNPTITLSDIPGAPLLKRVSIEADPVDVPLFQVEVPIGKASPSLIKAISAPDNKVCNPTFPFCQHGFIGGNSSASYPSAFTGYELFKDYLDQKAGIMMPTWSVRTLITGNNNLFNACPTNGFSGLVTTNASIYEGSAPTWDGSSLNYKVAGVHLDTDGNVFQGSYDLILKSDLARCLYKLSNAPISATISVVDSAGSSTITTTSFTESNGWAHMLARGFTFSSPTLKVTLKQDAPVPVPTPIVTASPSPSPTPTVVATIAPSPTPTVQPVTQAQKKITITCIKNKMTKLVTGVKPVCPAGYKKK